MPSTVRLRDDYDAVQLRGLARCSRDPRQLRRLLALAAVYDGMSRAEAARVGGMDRQTLRDWAHRFNEVGPASSPVPRWQSWPRSSRPAPIR
jgi:transposase